MTKWPDQKQTHRTAQKHAEHQNATDIQNKLFLCFSDFSIFIYDFLNDFFKKCSITALVRSMTFIRGSENLCCKQRFEIILTN